MQLFGQTPETALLCALAAIEFHNNQLQVNIVALQTSRQAWTARSQCMQSGPRCSRQRPPFAGVQPLHADILPK